jgi:hypothetical protein
MRRRLAPSHDLCARMRYVPADDSAWRWDLIDAECAELGEKKQYDHPYWVYFAGASRFDLDDPSIAPYIDKAALPEAWRFRRLTIQEREHCEWLSSQGRKAAANRHAFLCAVIGLENPSTAEGERLAKLLEPGDRSEKQKDAIVTAVENYASSAFEEVGSACIRGSQDLTPVEKKL